MHVDSNVFWLMQVSQVSQVSEWPVWIAGAHIDVAPHFLLPGLDVDILAIEGHVALGVGSGGKNVSLFVQSNIE